MPRNSPGPRALSANEAYWGAQRVGAARRKEVLPAVARRIRESAREPAHIAAALRELADLINHPGVGQ